MDPGDTVFFHPLLLHASGANLTQTSRRSISIHFASSTLCSYYDVGGSGQKMIAKEVQAMGRRILGHGTEIPYELFWKMKSRQVCGKEGNLGMKGVKR